MEKNPSSGIDRRHYLGAVVGAGASLLAGGCGGGTAATGDGPETTDMKFGIIALTDCSPLVIAHEKGFYQPCWCASSYTNPPSGGKILEPLDTLFDSPYR